MVQSTVGTIFIQLINFPLNGLVSRTPPIVEVPGHAGDRHGSLR
jgi:hypothetical protein